jgi:RNA polymerase sigma factor (sigma-70 family)
LDAFPEAPPPPYLPPMPGSPDVTALLAEAVPLVSRIAGAVARGNRMWGDDAEDFVSRAKMRLLEDDCLVLRRYRGDCELRTYLSVIVSRLFQEHMRERCGRWRHSAAAERLGPVARELEVLVRRDGWSLPAAAERLRTAGRTTLSDAELARVLAQLPERGSLRPREVDITAFEVAVPAGAPDDALRAREWDERQDRLMRILLRALARLSPEDAMIVRMHLAEGVSIADVARTLRLEQKPLYRRVERLRVTLRGLLEAEGMTGRDVAELVGEVAT